MQAGPVPTDRVRVESRFSEPGRGYAAGCEAGLRPPLDFNGALNESRFSEPNCGCAAGCEAGLRPPRDFKWSIE